MTHTDQVYSQISTDLFGQHCVSFKGGIAYFHTELDAIKAIFYHQAAAPLTALQRFIGSHNIGRANPNAVLAHYRPAAEVLQRLDISIGTGTISANDVLKVIDNELLAAIDKIKANTLHRHSYEKLKQLKVDLVSFSMRWATFSIRNTQTV